MHSQLLCTFTDNKELVSIIQLITHQYIILFEKIYVLQNLDNTKELFCTYNVEITENLNYDLVPNTISLHRKKYTNTLYTINGLNCLIKDLNNGILDKKYPIPWENVSDALLITTNNKLNKISTKIFQIIDID